MKLTDEQIAHVRILEDENGRITPDIVLADARREDSPLHPLFDWDTDKAAHAWWIECARVVIRAVKVVVTTETVRVAAPCYVRDPDATGQGYKSVEAFKRDPVSARIALREELNRAMGAVTRARTLALAFQMEGDMDEMLAKIGILQTRLEVENEVQHAKAS